MPRGRIRIKSLVKFLRLSALARERNRMLTIDEITQEIHCCRSHAYNYRRALRQMLPPDSFDSSRPRAPFQECLP